MQQKKNIRLLITWIILLAITIIVGLYQPSNNKLDIDKDYFSLKDKVNEINKITIESSVSNILLQKQGRNWSLNESLTADPSKINDLLGILSEVSVRRKASINTQKKINSSNTEKFKVTLFTDNQIIKSFAVAENENGTLTYFIDDIFYVVNIPGYNYHIADIFSLQTADWRSPYVFASNWTTLDSMLISYPKNADNNFEIVYDNLGYYTIPTIDILDTTAMYDYMQQVSFLQVKSYLSPIDSISRSADLNITVIDVGDQQIILDFYIYQGQTLGLINHVEWAVFEQDQVNSLVKYVQDFIAE